MLQEAGHSFTTQSDTEVILKTYAQFGVDAPRHLVGQFAFAIWDDQEKELFCARDRIGEKPFYYTIINGFDYLFSVDYDIVLPKDALFKLIKADKDIVSGVYIQRKHEAKVPELYRKNSQGGNTNLSINDVQHNNTIEIDGCGFGCALIKKNVLETIGYPQFVYHDTLDFQYTLSEDVDFCNKARDKGFKLFADCSIKCDHIGSYKFKV
mgnify:CR=1 FL=1